MTERIWTRIAVVFCIVALLVMVSDAEAEDSPDVNFGLILGSHHWDTDQDYNEKNYGGILELQWDVARVGVMSFENSYYEQATAIYYGADYYQSEHLDLGFNVAYVSGYDEDQLKMPIVPMLTAEIKFSKTRWVPALIVQGLPGEVIAFGVGWNIK